MNETIIITGADKLEGARVLAVRSALQLEIRGLKRHGRSARVLANKITGVNYRTAKEAYKALNDHIVETYGEQFDRPLS
jgi:hypothetical protein